MPVFPAVPSTIVPPGRNRPRASASAMMASPARSFTEPPGFMNSAFPRMVQPVASDARRRRISGVLPILRAAGVREEDHVYFLCRSGVRSTAAAEAARAAGFKHTYNIADGFEGPPDGRGMRGRVAGWQADGLPWTKD